MGLKVFSLLRNGARHLHAPKELPELSRAVGGTLPEMLAGKAPKLGKIAADRPKTWFALDEIKQAITQAKSEQEVLNITNRLHFPSGSESTEIAKEIGEIATEKMQSFRLASIQAEISKTKSVDELIALNEKLKSQGRYLESDHNEVKELLNARARELSEQRHSTSHSGRFASTIRRVADFRTLEEAKQYFNQIGVRTIFGSGAERHLQDLNKIKEDLSVLERNGVALAKPKTIVVSDWHDANEVRRICNTLGLGEKDFTRIHVDGINFGTNGYWGTTAKSADGQCHVLINSSFTGDYGHFKHEIGHIHQDHLESSFWHSKGFTGRTFADKQKEVLGLQNFSYRRSFYDGFNQREGVPNIFRYKCFDVDDPYNIALCMNEGNFSLNIRAIVERMARESGVYDPSKSCENVAEIFQGLNEGKTYSDFVMLAYDIMGGGRVPNRMINGMKYDDYIASLYRNNDLIRELRRSITVS